ncbi:gastric triacylglycerol lipase-like [Rhipicephalus sanguineus]|uniref:gastric triacylglycerol lipase-like n=1 Tax=Rhipicephalus sanguineus TaxID=34632 RepID=UPI0020C5331E|nr:gastric triacylglycerol lipase-like [Rhipicephalus sanguineus]
MNMTRFPVYVSNNPAGTSVRNIFHFSQLVKTNRFQRFDWGRRKNKKIYGQAEPPQYDIRKVTAPVALYWSDGDVMSCEEDVKRLERLLPNLVLSYKVPVHGFTHVDFAWSIFAKNHVYKKILEMMTKFSGMEPRVAQHHSLKSQRGHHASLGATHAHAPWSSGSSLEAQHLSTPPKHFVY